MNVPGRIGSGPSWNGGSRVAQATKTRTRRQRVTKAATKAVQLVLAIRGDKKWDVKVPKSVFGDDLPWVVLPTGDDEIGRVVLGARPGAVLAALVAATPDKAVETFVRACRVHCDRMEAGHKSAAGHRKHVDSYSLEIARGGDNDSATALRNRLGPTKTRAARAIEAVTGVSPDAAPDETAD